MRVQAIDIELMKAEFIAEDNKPTFSNLKRASLFKSVASILIDCSLIFGAYFLVLKSLLLIPLSLILLGSRQRALSNLTHDASHGNLCKNRKINDFIANLFCALPMFETVKFYRKGHKRHHQFLGDINKDPDSNSHLMYGYNDGKPWKGNPCFNFSKLIFNFQAIRSSFLGNLFNISSKEFVYVLVWWLSIGLILSSVFSTKTTILFITLWFSSKLMTYHTIRIVAEFLDHSGLRNDGILNFSRNLPHNGFLRFIFHPNCDTFHIVHHLYPKIPHYNLSTADKIISINNDYASAHHCDSYFFGKHSAINCWVGSCEGSTK